jgi:hypothetical protein
MIFWVNWLAGCDRDENSCNIMLVSTTKIRISILNEWVVQYFSGYECGCSVT